MRIIAGQAKGKRIEAPEGLLVRPTTDRAREAIFNTLYSLGGVESLTVADLFAGSGALGLEALSRGASQAVFIENSPAVLKVLRSNIAKLGYQSRSEVIARDVMNERRFTQTSFDVVFCDPPYSFDRWQELLGNINSRILVVESDRKIELNSHWKCLKIRKYATTIITIAESSTRPPKKALQTNPQKAPNRQKT